MNKPEWTIYPRRVSKIIPSAYSYDAPITDIFKKSYEFNIVMNEIKELEERVKALEIENKSLKKQKAKAEVETKVVYFKKFSETEKACLYLQDKGIDFQPIGSGTLLTTQEAVEILKEGDFKFGSVKNTKELYQKEPNLIKNYANQVRKHYGIPIRNKD